MEEEFNLKKTFELQKKFQELLGNDITTQEYRNEMFLGLFSEVCELLNATPFKKHKQNQSFNRENFIEECADIYIFLINLLMSANVDDVEFEKIIKAKIEKNFKRQDENY